MGTPFRTDWLSQKRASRLDRLPSPCTFHPSLQFKRLSLKGDEWLRAGTRDRLNAADPGLGWQQLMWVDLRGGLPFSHLWNPPVRD